MNFASRFTSARARSFSDCASGRLPAGRLAPSAAGAGFVDSRRCLRRHGRRRHRLKISQDRLEPFAPWFPLGMVARLHQVAERHEIPAPAAARLVAPPDLRRVVWLDGQRPLPRLLLRPQLRKHRMRISLPIRRISGSAMP